MWFLPHILLFNKSITTTRAGHSFMFECDGNCNRKKCLLDIFLLNFPHPRKKMSVIKMNKLLWVREERSVRRRTNMWHSNRVINEIPRTPYEEFPQHFNPHQSLSSTLSDKWIKHGKFVTFSLSLSLSYLLSREV